MHGEGRRRGRTVVRQAAQDLAELCVARAAAGEVRGHARGEEAVALQEFVVAEDGCALRIVVGCPSGELRCGLIDDRRPRFGADPGLGGEKRVPAPCDGNDP